MKNNKGINVTNMSKFYTLLLLSKGPKHGYELMKEVKAELGRSISPGQIYPFLERLKKNKLVEVVERGAREKKEYKLTLAGKKFVRSMIDKTGNLIDIAIAPKLTVCSHCGCKVYEGGYKKKIRGKLYAFCCSSCAKSYTP